MARQSRPTFQKRLKEKLRQERMREKQQKRFEAKERKANAMPRGLIGEDPDIAGIRPGPQRIPEEWAPFIGDEDEEEEEEEKEEEESR